MSWRRFWRSGPQTPRQIADDAAARIARAEAEAEAVGAGTYERAPDPYDYTLVERANDPRVNRLDKEQRVRAGQRKRARLRRVNENKHRRG
jgi:hypothetical protein